jgi:hypothetical protein
MACAWAHSMTIAPRRVASRRTAQHGSASHRKARCVMAHHGITISSHRKVKTYDQKYKKKTRQSLLGERHHLDRHKHHQHHSLFPAVHRAITHAPLCSLCASPSTPSIVPCCPPSHHRRTCLLAACLTNCTTGHSRCFQTVHSHDGACQVLHPTCQQQQHQQSTV